ncbi:hypothetical protein [Streptomyces sp. NPDC049585]|uniref:hypothetical protein n=1 Tax=Streptomyces sp. NPDC049585 TaxID=3155154 RepID=UPI003423A9CE
MADDHRYEQGWLDDDAVERLLRGEPLSGTAPADARATADQLTAALRALTQPAGPAGTAARAAGAPLPGEEAALAAFREARAARSAAESGVDLAARATVASGAARRRTPFAVVRAFLDRPTKALALALAGCAVGGVAVAAGAGVLPGPFGRSDGEPAPAASVTVADGGGPRTTAPATPGPSHGATPGPRPGHGPEASGTPGHGTGRTGGPSIEPGPDGPSPSRRGDGKPGKGGEDTDEGTTGDVTGSARATVAKLCRDFLADGKRTGRGKGVDEDGVRALERSAGGGTGAVRAYCERLLAGLDAGTSGSGSGLDDLLRGGAPRTRSLPRPGVSPSVVAQGVTLSGTTTL